LAWPRKIMAGHPTWPGHERSWQAIRLGLATKDHGRPFDLAWPRKIMAGHPTCFDKTKRREANVLSVDQLSWSESKDRLHSRLRTFVKSMSEWSVYIVRCSDDSLYSGISTDVEERVITHNAGRGAKYTRARLPVVLVWQEPASNESEARRRELQIKGWTRIKKLNLIKYGHPKAFKKSDKKTRA